MPFEFETLVGHLYVVGGRSISTAPPGTIVEVSPKKAARGRETDTFFSLVTPSGDNPAPTTFYERMAQHAAERYFDSSGSVTAGMRQVFNGINDDLYAHNQKSGQSYEANVLCAVLRGDDLIIGRVGCAVTLVLHDGAVQSSPESLTDDESLYIPPLGVHPIPKIKMAQFRVGNGSRAVFGDDNLADLDREKLEAALKADDIGAVLIGFKELARLQMTMMGVEFVPPEVETDIPIPVGESTVEISEKLREEATRARQTAETAAAVATTANGTIPTEQSAAERQKKRREKSLRKRVGRGLGNIFLRIGRWFDLLSQMIEHYFGGPDENSRRWMGTPLGAASVIVLPVVIVSAVIVLWISRAGETEFEICMTEAQSFAQNARSLANSERQTVLDAWNLTLDKVDECALLRPDEPTLTSLREEGRAVLDSLFQITRREAQIIESFDRANLSRMVMQGQSLYVLDSANGLVYSISLTSDGLGTTRPGTPIVRSGQTVQGFPVGEIIDIAYNDNGNDNVLVALDREGVVISCSPRFNQCSAQRLLGVETWENPVALTIWSDRLYILDTGIGNGQILRYDRSGGGYNDAPLEYFGGSDAVRPVLRSAIDFDIDDDGDVFVLLSEGRINRYRSGEPLEFEFAVFPEGQTLTNTTSMFLDDTPISQSVYVVDQGQRTIFETTMTGTFQFSYRVFEEVKFDLLSAVVAVPGQAGRELVYAASGNTVFVLQK